MDSTISLESPYMNLEFRGPLLVCTYKKNLIVDLSTAKKIVRQRLSFTKEKPYATLVDYRPLKGMNKEARDYLAIGESISGVKAMALLVENHLTVTMANLFVNFSKPNVPTEIFKNVDMAILWLQSFALVKDRMHA